MNYAKGLLIGKGNKVDVLIERTGKASLGFSMFSEDGPERPCAPEALIVWADRGLAKVIRRVEGVVFADVGGYPTKYIVHVDPRYDLDWVEKEIEAAIKCH